MEPDSQRPHTLAKRLGNRERNVEGSCCQAAFPPANERSVGTVSVPSVEVGKMSLSRSRAGPAAVAGQHRGFCWTLSSSRSELGPGAVVVFC